MIQATCPLTSVQAGMVFQSQLTPHAGIYTEQAVLDMVEPIRVELLQEAFRRLQADHDLLRTSFTWDGAAVPSQVVHEAAEIPWETHDWRAKEAEVQEEAWEARLAADRSEPWDFAHPPLMRCVLVRLGEVRWRLLWSYHHAIADGRAFAVFIQELRRHHRACLEGRQAGATPARPFRDYVSWLGARDAAADGAFWRTALQGVPEASEMGAFRAKDPFRYGTQRFRLAQETSARITRFVEHRGISRNVLMMGAWALLLNRYTGEEDVVFGAILGTAWAKEGGSRAVGLFINTLPMRVPVPPEMDVLPWLVELGARWRSLRLHERAPLGEIQRAAGLPPGQPLFQTMAMYDWADPEEALSQDAAGSGAWQLQFRETLETPLAVALFGTDNLTLRLGWDTRRFLPEDISRMAGHFETLLGALVDGPSAKLAALPMLSAAETRTLLHGWNATECIFAHDLRIHDLFEREAREHPERPAVVFEGHALTYGELENRARRLAAHLQHLGVGPEVKVGIAVDRSLEMLVGVLAILEAGGAFVPLNPDDPRDRLAAMLEQARCPVLLTQERLLPLLPPGPRETFCLDRDWPSLSDAPAALLPSGVGAENLAYVIFTSGSTGRPKGVMVTHRNVVGFLHAYRHVTLDGPRRIGTNVAPFNFDTSIEEIWSCLCFGGTVHILRPEQSADGAFFARYLLDHGITTTYIVPAVLEEVAAHLVPEVHRLRLRCLITGLHAKKERLLQAFRDLAPDLRILNAYGPTETTYGATAFAFATTDDPDRDAPIGMPFPGYQTYIVDARMRPVPIGVAGELLIGGIGVARGYLDQPELTGRAFIPDPWGPVPGGRLYRTGDRCRCRADGAIEFLGRTDHQIKLRGYRVELGEIEGALERHPAVRECVVVAVPDAHGGLRVVAYVAGEDLPAQGELRGFLGSTLPEYMIPAVFVPMQVLPRTTAGKVDRRALPEPGLAHGDPGRVSEPPRTPAEAFLAGIWREVLHLEAVGVHDPFFALGGQSLLAVRVIARIRKERGVEISLRRFFDQPTIAALAPLLETAPRPAVPGLKVLPRPPA